MINIPILANTNIQQVMQQATQSVQQAGQKMSQSMQSASSKISQSMNQAGNGIKAGATTVQGAIGNASQKVTDMFKAIPPQAMVAVGAITAVSAVITKLGTDYVQTASTINTMSRAVNMSTDEFQKWFVLVGKDEGAIIGIADTISSSLKDAMDPISDIGKAYKQLGVDVKKNDGTFKSQTKIMDELALALSGVTNDTERARLGYFVFSSDYRKIAPMLDQGTEAWKSNTKAVESNIVMSEKQVALGTEIGKQFNILSTAIKGVTYEALDPFMAVVNDVFSKIRDGSNVFGQQFILIGESLKSLGKTFSETFDTFANSNIFAGLVANLNIVIMTVDMLLFVFNKLFAGIELSLTGITLLLNGTIKKMGDFLVMMESLQSKAKKFLGTPDNSPTFKAFFEGLRDSGAKDFQRDLERIEVLKKKLLGEWKAPELKAPTITGDSGGKSPNKTPTKPTTPPEKKIVAESIIPVNEIKTASIQAMAEVEALKSSILYSFAPQNFTIWQAFSEITPLKNGLALVQKEISATQQKNLAIVQSNYDAQQQALDQNYVEMFVSDEEYLKQTQSLRASYETEKQSVLKQSIDAENQANKSASESFSQSIENRKEALSGLLLSATQTVWGAITTTASAFGSLQDTLHQNEMDRLKTEGDKRVEMLQEQMALTTMSARAKVLAEKRIADIQKKYEAEAQDREKAYNEKKKGWSITQATINGALAITGAFAEYKMSPMAFIMAGLSAVSTAAQIATISAQKFANGGIIGGANGASYGQDNTMVSARKGEMIINAPQQRELWQIVSGRSSRDSSVTVSPVITYNVSGNVSKDTMKRLKKNENEMLATLETSIKTLKRYGRI